MKIICDATLNNFSERNELRDSIRKLGVEPLAIKDMVYLEYEGETSKAEKLIQLFEKYSRHHVSISNL